MAQILHILTRPNDSLAAEVIARQKASQPDSVQVMDLTKPDPDYERLLELIFVADSVETW
jgi:hypothetical protein